MTIRRALFTTVTLSLLAAACTGDDDDGSHQTAVFSTADDAHLRRAIGAAAAHDLGGLWGEAIFPFGIGSEDDVCPTIETSGVVTTYTGGCTNRRGDAIAGTLVLTNFPIGEPSEPLTEPITLVAHGYSGIAPFQRVRAYEGTMTMRLVDGDLSNGFHLDGDLRAEAEGIEAHTVLAMGCDRTELCAITPGSWIDVDGLGAATLAGTYRDATDQRSGSIVLTGAETLLYDLALVGSGCAIVTIDGGSPREVCEPPQI